MKTQACDLSLENVQLSMQSVITFLIIDWYKILVYWQYQKLCLTVSKKLPQDPPYMFF